MSELEEAIAGAVKSGWIRRETIDGEDYVILTEAGVEWLRQDKAARDRIERIAARKEPLLEIEHEQ